MLTIIFFYVYQLFLLINKHNFEVGNLRIFQSELILAHIIRRYTVYR